MNAMRRADPIVFASTPLAMSKADDAHYELLTLAEEIYRQNRAVGGAVAHSTKVAALHAVGTARRAAASSNDPELLARCDEAQSRIDGAEG